ncbi:MAG: hypothetical protein EON59_11945 [Alphaproteobacteria bacterium]|nr:MAG: hypothetical protein EON59_11945 [Alphaproteobacteria bacterium]
MVGTMATPDADTPYCRLYIDTKESREAVQALLDALTSSRFDHLQVSAPVFKNHGYDPVGLSSRSYDPIEASPWTAEIDAEEGSPQAFETFQAGISAVIGDLRAAGFKVTASCDFEDRVAAETGWNWTSENPEPPG